MTTTLPNLSTWYPVPLGAKIPVGTPYAYTYENGINVRSNGPWRDFTVRDNSYYTYYTERIAPPLPTEEGATIMVSRDELAPYILVTREGGRWVTRYGTEWLDYQIRAWAPVTIGETVVMR